MKVTLFPFLSVLLCMMGAMIMLLVVVARNVQEQTSIPMPNAAESAQTMTLQEAEKLREEIEMKTEEADWFAENLVIAKKRAEEELAEQQAKLDVVERETQKVKAEIKRLEQLVKQLENQTPANPAEVERLKQILYQQKQRRKQAELELAELQREIAKNKKSYAIVPHQGQNGTFRRPIYIECRENKIIIQPEGIELVPNDFLAADSPDNPFDSALRVIRQYYLENNQIVRGSEPYPLMIVRPSGVEMYEGARQALGNWVKDFGYEIVNEDWKIEYPKPDEELRYRIGLQLEVSRSRMARYLAAMRTAERELGKPAGNSLQFRVDHRGNVIPTGDPAMLRSGEELREQLAASRENRNQEKGNKGGNSEKQSLEMGESMTMVPVQPSVAAERKPSAEQATSSAEAKPMMPQKESFPQEVSPQQIAEMQNRMMPKRPENWALKGATQFSSGISRTVKIRCERDRFVLSAQAGLDRERAIPIGASVSSSADGLVQAVWEFQESWGVAGENLHWKPILRVSVVPGGEQRLQELKTILKNSGMVIEN